MTAHGAQADLLEAGGAPVVDRGTAPTVPCAGCGLDAPRVFHGAGRDLHECRACATWTARWKCCGHVCESEIGTTAYRPEAICPGCGRDRFGERAHPEPLTGGVTLEDMAARARAEKEEEET